MADKKNNENKKNGMNKKEEKKMAKAMKKITVSMVNGQIMITAINGKKLSEQKRFGVYSMKENMLPHISIRPIKGSWLEMDVHVVEDENGKMTVEAVRESDAYWGFAEAILGSKKAVNKAKKSLIEARKNAIEKKQQQVNQTKQDNNVVVGATKTGYIYSKSLQGAQEEVIDLGEKFGTRVMRWGKGLDCTKIYNSDKEEVARIMWDKSGKAPRIRFMNSDVYYVKAYNEDAFLHFVDGKKVVVMDAKLANALWFFYKNFVIRLAQLKGWELPIAHKGMPQEYWDSLEKEYEAEEAARIAKKNYKNNGKV